MESGLLLDRLEWRRGARRLVPALALLGLASAPLDARAAGAIGFASWDGGVTEPLLAAEGDAAVASGVPGLASSMAGNPGLNGSAWAHTGDWWAFQVGDVPAVRIRVEAAQASELAPGVSVWASGAAIFDGGTTSFGTETSTAGFGTPHSFNAFGPLGDAGTLWMQDGQGGNAKQLLGYAIAGPSFLDATGWGETIENGAHDQRTSDDYATALSGSVGTGFAELLIEGIAPGWCFLYTGGTEHGLAGGAYTLRVHAVPEPGTALLVFAGIAVLVGRKAR
jgi:hypothetical protein